MSVFLTLDDLENFKKSYLYFQGVKLVGTWRFQQVVILEKNTEFLNVDYYGENVPSLNVHICAFVWDLINHSKSAKVLCSPTPVKQAVVLRIGRALSGGRPRMFQHETQILLGVKRKLPYTQVSPRESSVPPSLGTGSHSFHLLSSSMSKALTDIRGIPAPFQSSRYQIYQRN